MSAARPRVPPVAYRTAQRSARGVGRLTAAARVLPSFLIVGGQRCGTTSMFKALRQHPATLAPVLHKGVHYFDVHYDRSLNWYRGHFPLRTTALRTRGQAFESSPYYMFHPLAGERIARDLPGVRLLVLVRDPVERAHSAHAHELARGYETITSFEEAIEREPERLVGLDDWLRAHPHEQSHAHRHHGYLARGRYIDHLERLAALVGQDNILVVDSHDFFTNPEPVHDRVVSFLGLPPAAYPVFDRHNSRERSALPPALYRRLSEQFEPYDEKLAAWTGVTPSWRR
ncbi:MAG: sulfotransferase domain-containing protein [Frankiales bacterium]|nr:sulfotransferase domain-containing protein [Frankiales bacterium]